MTGSNTAHTALAGELAISRWRERGARLDANIQRHMRVTMTVVAIALTIGVIWVSAVR